MRHVSFVRDPWVADTTSALLCIFCVYCFFCDVFAAEYSVGKSADEGGKIHDDRVGGDDVGRNGSGLGRGEAAMYSHHAQRTAQSEEDEEKQGDATIMLLSRANNQSTHQQEQHRERDDRRSAIAGDEQPRDEGGSNTDREREISEMTRDEPAASGHNGTRGVSQMDQDLIRDSSSHRGSSGRQEVGVEVAAVAAAAVKAARNQWWNRGMGGADKTQGAKYDYDEPAELADGTVMPPNPRSSLDARHSQNGGHADGGRGDCGLPDDGSLSEGSSGDDERRDPSAEVSAVVRYSVDLSSASTH